MRSLVIYAGREEDTGSKTAGAQRDEGGGRRRKLRPQTQHSTHNTTGCLGRAKEDNHHLLWSKTFFLFLSSKQLTN